MKTIKEHAPAIVLILWVILITLGLFSCQDNTIRTATYCFDCELEYYRSDGTETEHTKDLSRLCDRTDMDIQRMRRYYLIGTRNPGPVVEWQHITCTKDSSTLKWK